MAADSGRPPRVLLATARFYPDIADALGLGARAALDAAGAEVDAVDVPGAFELPAAIAFAAGSGAYRGRLLGYSDTYGYAPDNYRVELESTAGAMDSGGKIVPPPYDGYVALGCVIRGETAHFDYVCRESAHGLARLSVDRRLAIGYGVLTVETREQAWARAAPGRGDKGGAAARACLAMMALRKRLGGAS